MPVEGTKASNSVKGDYHDLLEANGETRSQFDLRTCSSSSTRSDLPTSFFNFDIVLVAPVVPSGSGSNSDVNLPSGSTCNNCNLE